MGLFCFWIRSIAAATLLAIGAPLAIVQAAPQSQLLNQRELYQTIEVEPGRAAAIADFFPSFLEYQDLVMFHPTFGYYASGRVSFQNDYRTYPIVLAPYFGEMVAEQVFRMWQGMRKAGTLTPDERFTIAEFGGGDGSLAESVLDYLQNRSATRADSDQWHAFADQVLYVCYDRSPALSRQQRDRNARFGKRFEAREADATAPEASIAPGSLKGVFLSNELPDAFSVQKVILHADGEAQVAFVVPSLSGESWENIKPSVPEEVAAKVESGDKAVQESVLAGQDSAPVYLTRDAFTSLLEALVDTSAYAASVQKLRFHEVYVPVSVIPELAGHLRRYSNVYAGVLARTGRGVVTYINPGVEKYIYGASRVLSAGYVLTIDYGFTWEGILAEDYYSHLRTYGPAHRNANAGLEFDGYSYEGYNEFPEQETNNPYDGPTLNDLTTDVNFSLVAAEGDLVGIDTLFYGPQHALQTGTHIQLDYPSERSNADLGEFESWASAFATDQVFRLMVQQKEKTDPDYRYPDTKSDPLGLDQSRLTPEQQAKAAIIARRLSGSPAPAASGTPAPQPVADR